MAAAIDRELDARAMGMKMTPEEQLGMFGAGLYDRGGARKAKQRHRSWWRSPAGAAPDSGGQADTTNGRVACYP